MNNEELNALIQAIVEELDYDLAKQLDPDTAESPDEVEGLWERLRAAAKSALPVDLLE